MYNAKARPVAGVRTDLVYMYMCVMLHDLSAHSSVHPPECAEGVVHILLRHQVLDNFVPPLPPRHQTSSGSGPPPPPLYDGINVSV